VSDVGLTPNKRLSRAHKFDWTWVRWGRPYESQPSPAWGSRINQQSVASDLAGRASTCGLASEHRGGG
jgi:hypothetical protein